MREPAGPREDRCDRIGRGRLTLLVQAVVAGHRSVRRFRFDRPAVGAHQHRRHQTQRAEALRDRVGLHVAVVVLARPDELAAPLERSGDHVVDQPMLVGDPGRFEPRLELAIEDLLEDVLEAPVVELQDRVLRREIHRPAAHQSVVEAGAREAADRLVEIVHRHRDAAAGELEDLAHDRRAAAVRREAQGQLPGTRDDEIGRPVLIAEGVTADHDRVRPSRHQPRHVLADDRLAKDRPVQLVADRPVRRLPHLLEAEFLDPRLVGCDGGALDPNAELLDGTRRIEGDLVVGRVAVLDRQVKIS